MFVSRTCREEGAWPELTLERLRELVAGAAPTSGEMHSASVVLGLPLDLVDEWPGTTNAPSG